MNKVETDITEIVAGMGSTFINEIDVSEYKWKVVKHLKDGGLNIKVHLYKEDFTKDNLVVNLSSLVENCARKYKRHLELEKSRIEQEKRDEKEELDRELLNSKLDELIDSYEIFIKQFIKDDFIDMRTDEDRVGFDEDLKFNLTNIRKSLNDWFTAPNGISWGRGNKRKNQYSIREEWYLENLQKFKDIILTFCPSYEPPSSPIHEQPNSFPEGSHLRMIWKFMNLDNINKKGGFHSKFHTFYEHYADTQTQSMFYEKLMELHRRMKKEKIGYWRD